MDSVFDVQIAQFAAKAKGNADLVVRKVALDLLLRVIAKSPVDSGRFKSSWVVSLNAIPTGDPGTIDKTGGPSITRVKSTAPLMKLGDVITMTSNLAYSRRLEYGYSGQAPEGMVRLTIQEWNGVVAKAVTSLP